MKVSVLIGSRNRPHMLSRCLESVLRQDYPNLEVTVLDDASDDAASYSSLVKSYPGVRLLRSDSQCGVAGGRNKLVSEASGDVLCFIDDDAYFEDSTAISRFVSIFQRDPHIGIVACKIVNHCYGRTELRVPFSRRALRRNPQLAEEPRYVSYYLGGCHAIRRDLVEQCGTYHDELVFGEEELDLSYRVIGKGYRIYYEPKIVVHHVPHASVVDLGPARQGRRNELYFHIRNRFYLAYRYLPVRYIPIYLCIWMSKYTVDAIRCGGVMLLFRGIMDGVRLVRGVERQVLDSDALRYLKYNHGRLWY